MKLSQEQILQISKGDTEIAAFITMLTQRIEQLEARVQDLERQLNQNSKNSSKPPSSDGLRKPTNLRQAGGKKGAPKGHKGHTLHFVEHPDDILVHPVSTCSACSASLEWVPAHGYERRQFFELPAPRMVVTEHRAEKKCCPYCHAHQRAAFPERVNVPVQYGDSFAARTGYLHAYQILPLERIGQLFTDLTGYRPSQGTLLSHIEKITTALEPIDQVIRRQLLKSAVLHADETSLRTQGKRHWMHAVSNAEWTLLTVHANRGGPGIDAMDILPHFRGVLVHDCYWPYFKKKYAFEHALCNAHLLRECQGIADHDKHRWASEMKALLQESWKLAQAARQKGQPVAAQLLQGIERRYDEILSLGETEWTKDVVREKTSTQGRKIKSKAGNLGQRFILHKKDILRFLRDARIPFDNNQAERDIRMVKVKEKISGTFRTELGSDRFARIRSFISTLRKQNLSVLSSLTSVLRCQFSF